MPSIDTVRQHIAGQFFLRANQAWLKGYHEALELWSADPSLQNLTQQVAQHWLGRTDPHTDQTAGVPTTVIVVGCVNIAMRKSKDDPKGWLQLLADAGPPDMTAIRTKRTPDHSLAEEAWYWGSVGLGAPRYTLLLGSWNSMTPAFRELVKNALPPNHPPMPDRFGTPEAVAWLEKLVHSYERPEDVAVLNALRELSGEQAEMLAGLLMDQHAAWQQANVFTSGCGDMVGNVVPSHLAELVCFHAPLSEPQLQRATALDLTWPTSILLRPGEDLIEKLSQAEHPGIKARYLTNGFVLKECSERPDAAEPVIASGLAFVKLPRRPPLLTVLDIDLTHNSVSFLGLQGKRLRICSPATSFDQPFFTRVDLNGGVKPMSLFQKFPKPDDDFDLADVVCTLGRPLVSPYEGLNDAGGCLGQEERFGGAPDWEQYPEDPVSPASGEPMTFLAQFEHALGGTAYAFLDLDNLIAAVVIQHG